jgi:hypothetical protein
MASPNHRPLINSALHPRAKTQYKAASAITPQTSKPGLAHSAQRVSPVSTEISGHIVDLNEFDSGRRLSGGFAPYTWTQAKLTLN